MKATVRYVQVEGYRARYEVVGEGEPLILVHGLSGSTLWWRRNVPVLARHYRVYSVDLPGFGSMHFPRSRFVLTQAGAWLIKWMQAIELPRANFIGHSMGGYICLWLAAHHPERVSHLVLAAPALVPRANTVWGYLGPLLMGSRYMSPSFFGILLYDALRAGPVTLFQATRDLIAQSIQDDMRHVQAPTLLLWGDHDTLVLPLVGPVVREAIPGSRLYLLKGAGHVCMFDRAREFNTAVLAFLAGKEVGEAQPQ